MRLRRLRPTVRGRQLRLLLGVLRRLTGDAWSATELAEDLAVHRRTIYRVLNAMRRERLPLEAQPREDGKTLEYRLPRRWWEPDEGRRDGRRRHITGR